MATIHFLKKLIYDLEGTPLEEQRLVYGGPILDDSWTIEECGIQYQSSIYLLYTLRGGGPGLSFADIENKTGLSQVPFTKSAPDWRIACPGLNLEGVCKNKSCKAYGKEVICQIGIGVFDIVLKKNLCVCPMCKKWCEPLTCGFTKCFYKYTGLKQDTTTRAKKSDSFRMERSKRYL